MTFRAIWTSNNWSNSEEWDLGGLRLAVIARRFTTMWLWLWDRRELLRLLLSFLPPPSPWPNDLHRALILRRNYQKILEGPQDSQSSSASSSGSSCDLSFDSSAGFSSDVSSRSPDDDDDDDDDDNDVLQKENLKVAEESKKTRNKNPCMRVIRISYVISTID